MTKEMTQSLPASVTGASEQKRTQDAFVLTQRDPLIALLKTNNVPHERIAEFVGISQRTVSKTLSRLRKEGMLEESTRSRVRNRNPKEMEKLKDEIAPRLGYMSHEAIGKGLGITRVRVTQIAREIESGQSSSTAPPKISRRLSLDMLTRQANVLQLILAGHSILQIAEKLKVSTGTVQNDQADLVVRGELDPAYVHSSRRREQLIAMRDARLHENLLVTFPRRKTSPTVVFSANESAT